MRVDHLFFTITHYTALVTGDHIFFNPVNSHEIESLATECPARGDSPLQAILRDLAQGMNLKNDSRLG